MDSTDPRTDLLSLRIVRGPLNPQQEQVIVAEFNRLTRSAIPLDHFRRWVRSGPQGPACHALLETEDARIVGHFCLIPLSTEYQGRELTAARTEYFFVHEDFRRAEVRGFENSLLSSAILLLDQLYRHCQALGWEPLLASASDAIQPFHRLVGSKPADLPLFECLFVLRPWRAARFTSNLTLGHRTAIFLTGLAQKTACYFLSPLLTTRDEPEAVPAAKLTIAKNGNRMAFFHHAEALAWRYPEGEYTAYSRGSDPNFRLIVKHGSAGRYLRVCDWRVDQRQDFLATLLPLIRLAKSQKALGVRWPVYGDAGQSLWLLRSLRSVGFVCVRRSRRLLVNAKDKSFLSSRAWDISDSFFSFDL